MKTGPRGGWLAPPGSHSPGSHHRAQRPKGPSSGLRTAQGGKVRAPGSVGGILDGLHLDLDLGKKGLSQVWPLMPPIQL